MTLILVGYLPHYTDLRHILESYDDSYVLTFDSSIISKADNRDFFSWEIISNGMLTHNSTGFEYELEKLSYPIFKFSTPKPPNLVPILYLLLLD